MADAQFDKMVDVNLKSAYRLTRLVAPGMCQRGSDRSSTSRPSLGCAHNSTACCTA